MPIMTMRRYERVKGGMSRGVFVFCVTILVVHAVAEEVPLRTTFSNPIDIEYRRRPETTGYDFREAADPEIVLKDGRYWLFASKCGGYFVSDDLIGWRFLTAKGLPFEEYAPTVETIGGKLNYSARGGTVDREIDAASGRWERIKGCMAHTCDSALFRDEDGRLYCYWASDPEGKRPISGCELDPVTFADLTQPQSLMEEGVLRYGWEVRGHCNDRTDKPSYIEGPHMIRRGLTYYLQYAGPGTEWDGYCDTALTGPSPLGPFARQRMNPFSFKPTGYVRGAGHGKTFSDKYGNWWHVTTCVIQGVNRRLVMFPVFFDVDGEMWCDTAFADWPIRVPDRKVSDPQGFRTGWMELTVGKCAVASSTCPESKVEDALDRNARTSWSASGGQGETFQVDLGGLAVVRAVQIGFDDVGEKYHGRHPENAILFRVEASDDGLDWRTVVNRSENDREAEHPYFELAKPEKARHLRIVCLGLPKGQNFALREFRAFGSMDKSKPAVVHGLRALRDSGDRRHVSLFWMPAPDVTGYLIRYGVNKKKMHLSYVTSGTSLEIRSLDAEENYVWSICGFNEAGFGPMGEGSF